MDNLIVICVVAGGLGFMAGWFGAWIVGAFKSLTEEERRIWDKLNDPQPEKECKCRHDVCEEWRE